MNNCDQQTKLFSDYIDNTIDEKAKLSLQTHLNNCSACKTKVDDLLQLKHSLASLPRVKTSESFDVILHARLRQQIRAEKTRRWSFPFLELNWKTPAYALAALVLLFSGAFLQRMSTAKIYRSQNSSVIAVENAVQRQRTLVDPGYMVLVGMDSVKNTYTVMNYVDVDKGKTMEEFKKRILKNSDDAAENLPNLKEAPQKDAFLILTKRPVDSQKIKSAEFVF